MDREGKILKRWTRLLTSSLANLPIPPIRVEAHAGKGLRILLHSSSGGFLHVCLTAASEVNEAFVTTKQTALRFLEKRSLTSEEQAWLDTLKTTLYSVERQAGWVPFLSWATHQPAVALPSSGLGPEQEVAPGNAELIRLTTRCNARCEFCSARGVLPDLMEGIDQVRNRLLQMKRRGLKVVSFTGGEPTLLKDLPEMVRLAREVGMPEVDVQTNGLLLARPKVVQRLAEAGMSSIFLSLHSAKEAVHDVMLKVKGAFRKAIQGAARCLDAGMIVRYNCVLSTLNLEGADELVGFIAQHFQKSGAHVCLSFIAPQGWALDHPELVPRLSQAAPRMAAALEAGKQLGLDVRVPGLCGIPLCLLPGYEKHFDEFHRENPPQLATRSYVANCTGCFYRSRCSGFWTAYLDRFGGDELGPRET